MPKALEVKLKKQAKKKGMSKKRMGAYVYGTMRKMGWKPGREEDMMKGRMHVAITKGKKAY